MTVAETAGFKGDADDCVCRAIAIAADLPYKTVYDRLAEGNASQRKSRWQTISIREQRYLYQAVVKT